MKFRTGNFINLCAAAFCAFGVCATIAQAWQSDNGDGTFTNPPLYADYPDPDIIRVGEDFYFATTTFVNSPGLTILHSRDLVNWQIVSHVLPRLDGRGQYDLKDGGDYRHGVFAPSLRHHQGTFYIAVTPVDQNTRIYYSKDIRGPWQFHELDRPAFDPGLFIEADGKGCIATSGGWDGPTAVEQLKTLAVARVFLDNIENIQWSGGGQGLQLLQMGLRFGANDAGSVAPFANGAAAANRTSEEDLRRIIRDVGFQPVQRDASYRTMFLN